MKLVTFLLFLQTVYRIMVEILNENDNFPVFAEDTVHSLILSEVSRIIQTNVCLHSQIAHHKGCLFVCLLAYIFLGDSSEYGHLYRPCCRCRQ